MNKNCNQCSTTFEITESDLTFYEKVSPTIAGKKQLVPPPTLCPDCRQIRRIGQINQINLYKRKSDVTGKDIISNYHPSAPYKVYEQEYWWSDKWDPLEYGRDFDFKRPFFEQYQELALAVPRPNLYTGYQRDENCEYTNYSGKNKDSYFIFDSDLCREVYYSYSANSNTNCIDCHRTLQAELCYENIDTKNCYNTKYVTNSTQCVDSAFLDDCHDCKNCFMSFNLQHKQYYLYNKPSTKEEYEKFMSELSSRANVEKYKKEFQELKKTYPKKYSHGVQNENVVGDYLTNCKNVEQAFDCYNCWDCKYAYQAFGSDTKDCMDFDEIGDAAQLAYECCNSGYNLNNSLFCMHVLDQVSDLMYCNYCHYSSYLFGCVALKRKKYCILNKQYTQEEYEKIVPKIIEHMRTTGEWGEFFPLTMSSFAYNESWATLYQPLSKEEVLKRGYSWRDDDKKKIPQKYDVPDDIKNVPDSVLQEVLACVECKENFKLIPQELKFYRDRSVPIPAKCFKCRHYARMASRNPRKLYNRECDKCKAAIQTTYAPDRPEKVYCEKCYLEAVY